MKRNDRVQLMIVCCWHPVLSVTACQSNVADSASAAALPTALRLHPHPTTNPTLTAHIYITLHYAATALPALNLPHRGHFSMAYDKGSVRSSYSAARVADNYWRMQISSMSETWAYDVASNMDRLQPPGAWARIATGMRRDAKWTILVWWVW